MGYILGDSFANSSGHPVPFGGFWLFKVIFRSIWLSWSEKALLEKRAFFV
jgi:hypothetical protein